MENDLIYRLKGDKVIWIIVFLLSLISIAAVYSSSSSLAFRDNVGTFDILLKQMRFVVFGLTALFICYKIPMGLYRWLAFPGIILSLALLILTAFAGVNINNAERAFVIMGISFQPSEIAKIAIILYLAKVLETFEFESFKEFMIWIIAPIGVSIIFIFNGSASAALLVGIVVFTMLIIANIKWSHILKAAGIAAGALALLVLLNLSFGLFPRIETATSRLTTYFVEQHEDTMTPQQLQALSAKTFQADMAEIAVASGGILGKGPGKSTQRNLLPHPYSDYIYAIIIEEWGFLGGLFVLMLYVWLFTRCIMLVRSCTKIFTISLVAGLGVLITTQALVHILVNVGLLPVTGHTLPLISLGGTSFIIMSGAFGIILSVSRTIEMAGKKREEAEQVKREEQIRGNNNIVELSPK
jgi:Bacterial cell division membrane protein